MRVKQIVASMGMSLALLGTLGLGLVGAAPSNAPSSDVQTGTCTDGANTWDAVVFGNGEGYWTPGHVVSIDDAATNKTYIPLSVSGTFYPDEPIDGQTQIELFNDVKSGKRNGVRNVVTCAVPAGYFNADDPENPFGVGGNIVVTVTVFEAGNSH
jgi:hypothetical protein